MNKLKLFFGLFLGATATFSAIAANSLIEKSKEVSAAGDTYSLAGSMNKWSATDTTYDLTDSDGDGIYTTNALALTASTNLTFKVVKNHSWDVSYGFDNLLIQHSSGTAWSDSNDKNVGLWNSTDLNLTVCFRPSDSAIFVMPRGTNPTAFQTFYLLVNNQEGDDWTGDWSNPRLHYFNDSWKTVWEHIPTLTNANRSYYGGGKTGDLYSLQIPTNATKVLATKSNSGDGETKTLDISSGYNAAYFYWDSDNYLKGFNLTVVDNGAYLRGDWTKGGHDGWTVDGQIAMTSSSIDGPYSITGVDLGAGSAVKAVYMEDGVETWAQFNSVSTNDEELYPVIEVDDGKGGYNAGVQSRGTYNIVVTKNGTKWDYAFTGTSNLDLDDAIDFAENFVTAMVANCPHTSTGGSSSKVASTWSAQKGIYEALDEDVQFYLLDADSTVKEIEDFFSSYDYIYGHYASVREITGADFLGRNPATVASLSINLIGVSINGNGAAPIIVSVIAVISLTAIGGYYFLKKGKKEKENTK